MLSRRASLALLPSSIASKSAAARRCPAKVSVIGRDVAYRLSIMSVMRVRDVDIGLENLGL